MKSLLHLLIFAFCLSTYITAQTDKSNSSYLFEDFQDAIIFYKDGRQFAVPLNFNLANGRYVFIDKTDQREKEFSDPSMVVAMHVGKRIFLMSEGKATEVIQADPKFHVSYTPLKKKAPAKVTYGGTTETASVDSYTGLTGKGIISGVRENNRVVADISRTYEVQLGKRNRNFYNKRSFLKIFPKDKKANLESYIEENETDFDSVEQVFQLYQYAIKQ
ncbi:MULTISPECIES: hypothetical protein [Proteiniphilum]|jgi:hypothetical protein|uniref:hypothetical protein n=2 Tax=Dysgonomonadaceae TaxID=2005520 RepID=UPI001EEB643D|nr:MULTISPECIES: hypothetical protein [Proteiniphilum]ULB35306.1 hypothetical protein KDN43_04505 [Proteiniphilum propionicum]